MSLRVPGGSVKIPQQGMCDLETGLRLHSGGGDSDGEVRKARRGKRSTVQLPRCKSYILFFSLSILWGK